MRIRLGELGASSLWSRRPVAIAGRQGKPPALFAFADLLALSRLGASGGLERESVFSQNRLHLATLGLNAPPRLDALGLYVLSAASCD